MHPLTPPNSHHLEAAHGWLELGDHVAAFDELEKIEPKLRGHPDVLEVRVDIFAKAGKWDYCVEIGDALVRFNPERPSGWLKRSHALHQLGKTQEDYASRHACSRTELLTGGNLVLYSVHGCQYASRNCEIL